MKKKILLLMGIFSLGLLQAQVGINTTNPQGVFHIDGQGNTSGATNTTDDLLVDADGNIGIGTVSPQARLDIMGNLIVSGGDPVMDHVLTSDNQGIGSWKEFDRSKGVAIWGITGTGITFPTSTTVNIVGTQTLSDSDNMGFSLSEKSDASVLIVPTGTYLIITNFDVNVREYGTLDIREYGNTSNRVYTGYYGEQLTGGSTIFTFTAPTTIYISCAYRNLPPTGITRYTATPITNANVWSSVTFISLTK